MTLYTSIYSRVVYVRGIGTVATVVAHEKDIWMQCECKCYHI